MGQRHPSTPEQRAQWAITMLAQPQHYGLISRLARQTGASRPTLYAWRAQAQLALLQTFTTPSPEPTITPALKRQVLTIWSAHSSDRDIQRCFQALTAQGIGLTTITAILNEAEARALHYLATHMPPTPRAIALDEIYAKDRHGAYLSIADVHSGALWACVGPLNVDQDSWPLLLWQVQDDGLVYDRVVLDGGPAARAAAQAVSAHIPLQSDQWHVLHSCTAIQGRLERRVRALQQQSAVVERQAARVAAGQRPRGPNPKTDLLAHAAELALAERVVKDVRFLMQELHRLVDVVVIDQRGVLDIGQRQAELDTLLQLLEQVAHTAARSQQQELWRLKRLVSDALEGMLTFVGQLERVSAAVCGVLNKERQALLGWAWLRRRSLGWSAEEIVAAVPQEWRAAARVLLMAWDDAVRVSTAVERWHSIVRVHLAVHRKLSVGRLALLVVWHNHRGFTCGVHKGRNPMQLSGIADAPSDWLEALGYGVEAALEQPQTRMADLALAA